MNRNNLSIITLCGALLPGCALIPIELGEDAAASVGSSALPSGDSTTTTSFVSNAHEGTTLPGDESSIESEVSLASQSDSSSSGDGGVPAGEPLAVESMFAPSCLRDLEPLFYTAAQETSCAGNYQSFITDRVEPYCQGCGCHVPCTGDDGCPTADDSEFVFQCFLEGASGTCGVACYDDMDCPTGTQCLEDWQGGRCWVIEDSLLECTAMVGEETPCESITTEVECNGVVSDHSLLRCRWAEEQLYGDTGDVTTCTPTSTRAGCMAVRELEGEERDDQCDSNCEAAGSAYWGEIGGGTYGLIDLPCQFAPVSRSRREFTGCGTTQDPLLCGCAASATCG